MTEINLFHTSGVNPADWPAGQPDAPKPDDAGTATSRHFRSLQSPAEAGAEASLENGAGNDPASCITAELPVLSGIGQIFGADGKPAGHKAR